jgi:hypothetical protein
LIDVWPEASWRNDPFAREVQDLKLGDGDEFRGEGILAITKALLQSNCRASVQLSGSF